MVEARRAIYAPRTLANLVSLNVCDSGFSTAAIDFGVEGHFLSLTKAREASALKCRDVHENVLAAIVWLDEAIAFGCVEELHGSGLHVI